MPQKEDNVSQPIPLAVIGAGRVAHAVYIPLLRRACGQFRLVAVVETDPTRGPAVAEHFGGVPLESDIASAVGRGARAAICATPWYTHAAVVAECLRYGLHVLCEKPVSIDPAEIARLRELEAASGVPVAAAYMKRHSAVVAELIEQASALMTGARDLSVEVVDPNASHQIAHLVPANVLRRTPAPQDALDLADRMLPGAPAAHREALLHSLGGSLVHHVNLVHAILDSCRLDLAGNLVYATQWAGGQAVACGWRPREDFMVRLSHVRVPGHRRYRERIQLITDASAVVVALPSPYARDEAGEIAVTEWDEGGRERTTAHRGVLADSPFASQLAAWAAMINGVGPALPGLAEAHRDASVIHQAARRLT